MGHNSHKKPRHPVIKGVLAAWPICAGYLPIGLAFGIIAGQNGLSILQIFLMALLVFAGSAQFIAVSMIAAAAAPLSIIATTFMVNLRHLLMSSALAVHLKGHPRHWYAFFAYGITDESFALNYSRLTQGNWEHVSAMALNYTALICWVICCISGALLGEIIPAGACGIDYALSAMFLCLLVFQLRGAAYVATALVAGVLALVLAKLIPGNSYIIISAITAATAGVYLKPLFKAEKNEAGDL